MKQNSYRLTEIGLNCKKNDIKKVFMEKKNFHFLPFLIKKPKNDWS